MTIYGWGMIVYLILLLGVGYMASKTVKNQEDFMVAGRSATKIMLLATFVGTVSSGSTWIGGAGFYYKFGWSQIWQGPGTCIPGVIILLFIGPYLRRFAQFTVSDFYETRYRSKKIRMIAASIIVCLYFTIMIAQLMSGARVVETALGWNYKMAMIIFSVILIIYSCAGGQTAVIWCDTMQFFVMMIASVGALFCCLNAVGGFSGLNAALSSIDPNLIKGDGGGSTPWTMALAWTFIWGLGNSAQPYTLGRFYCAKDVKTAVIGAGVGAFIISFFWILVGIVGLTARVKFPDLASIDLAYPAVATKLFPTPIGVLAICGLMAAIISTLDTLLVTLGTTVGRDIYQQILRPDADSKRVLFVSRMATLLIGSAALIFAMNPPGPVLVITSFAWSVIASAFFVPLVAGIHWKRANKTGAILSMVGGAAVTLLWFYANKPFGLHPVIPGVFSSVVFLVVGSLATKAEDVSALWAIIHPTTAKS